MNEILCGTVQPGKGDAAHWLQLFNHAYQSKLGSPVFPGSLNLALDQAFDWFAPRHQAALIPFSREEYGGERDILFLPCRLASLDGLPAWLWTTTTAARDRADPHVIEIICAVRLREMYKLGDGSPVCVELPSV